MSDRARPDAHDERILAAAAHALGEEIRSATAVSGGDINDAWALELAGGTRAFLKSRRDAPADEFGAEAAGLRWLAEPGGLPVAEVLAVIDEEDARALALAWIERGRPAADADELLGRGLATIHVAGAERFDALPPDSPRTELRFGGGEVESFGGETWAEVYDGRLERLARSAVDAGAISPRCADAVDAVRTGLERSSGPEERPARIHGDLWSGNVLTGADGGPWLIDPKAHGAHREMDMAMLDLFGVVSTPTAAAYDEIWPLADGWRERLGLWQLQPLLVHAILFGGSYGAAVERTAQRYV